LSAPPDAMEGAGLLALRCRGAMPSGAHSSRIGGGPRMNSVGIDLHRKRSHVAVIDADGTEVLSRRIVNDPDTFLELLGEIDGESKVALEATYGWEWLAELLEQAVLRAAPRASLAHQGDRLRAGEDRRGRRPRAGAAAARGPAARGLRRSARAARPARSAAPPGGAHPTALGAQEPSMRCWPSTASCTATAICPARAAAGSWPHSSSATAPAAAGELACPDP
jgi:hypothetical protein